MYVCAHACTFVLVCKVNNQYISISACMYICGHVCMYRIRMSAHVHVCKDVCMMYTWTCTRTRTHIYTERERGSACLMLHKYSRWCTPCASILHSKRAWDAQSSSCWAGWWWRHALILAMRSSLILILCPHCNYIFICCDTLLEW